jgi:hypothetical protein
MVRKAASGPWAASGKVQGTSPAKSPSEPSRPGQRPRWRSSPGRVDDRRRPGAGPGEDPGRVGGRPGRPLIAAGSSPGPAPGPDRAREGQWTVTGLGTLIPGWVEGRLPGLLRAPHRLPLARPVLGRILLPNSHKRSGAGASRPAGQPIRPGFRPSTSPGNLPTLSAWERGTDASPRRSGRIWWPRRGRPGLGRDAPGTRAVSRHAEEDVL